MPRVVTTHAAKTEHVIATTQTHADVWTGPVPNRRVPNGATDRRTAQTKKPQDAAVFPLHRRVPTATSGAQVARRSSPAAIVVMRAHRAEVVENSIDLASVDPGSSLHRDDAVRRSSRAAIVVMRVRRAEVAGNSIDLDSADPGSSPLGEGAVRMGMFNVERAAPAAVPLGHAAAPSGRAAESFAGRHEVRNSTSTAKAEATRRRGLTGEIIMHVAIAWTAAVARMTDRIVTDRVPAMPTTAAPIATIPITAVPAAMIPGATIRIAAIHGAAVPGGKTKSRQNPGALSPPESSGSMQSHAPALEGNAASRHQGCCGTAAL
jgi:hypothetical protein